MPRDHAAGLARGRRGARRALLPVPRGHCAAATAPAPAPAHLDRRPEPGVVHLRHRPWSPEEAWERLIIGGPERCIRQIQALEAVGVDLLLMNMNFGNMTHPEAMRSLRLFGREVLPAFKR